MGINSVIVNKAQTGDEVGLTNNATCLNLEDA